MQLGFQENYFSPSASGTVNEVLRLVTVRAPDGHSYVYDSSIILAVNVALATQRPLFISGAPGTGKTTLARSVAHVLGWRYYQHVVTSRTRAKDLMWTFDSLRRLSDAQEQNKELPPRAAYVQPQVLWWAFDSESAEFRGASAAERNSNPSIKPSKDPALGDSNSSQAVVLLDEIDKADPDVPNDLLEALDVERFTVDELDDPRVIQADAAKVLLMITTNGERELPPAFLRRCVVLQLQNLSEDWLVTIANDRFGATNDAFHRAIAQQVMTLRARAAELNERPPSTAEYLDAILACNKLGIGVASDAWHQVTAALLLKRAQSS